MKRQGAVLLTCVALGVLIVLGAGLQGAAQFSGIRWVPDFRVPEQPVLPPRRSGLPTASPVPSREEATSAALDLTLVLWILASIVAVVCLVLLWRWLARRPARTAVGVEVASLDAVQDVVAEPVQTLPSAPVLQRGFARAIDALDAEREPHDAIVKAWLGVQEAAAESGIRRRAAETPTEFTTRILARVPADGRAVTTLLNAYLGVRFGDHPVTASDLARVRSALSSLAESWDAARQTGGRSVPAPPWEHRK